MPTYARSVSPRARRSGPIGSITNPTAAQANAVFGGNLELDPETAKTWTLGVVFQPEFLPRFSMSLDYYNIRIKDVIGSALPGDVIKACFGDNHRLPAPSDPDCLVIRRNPIHRRPRRRSGDHSGPVPGDDQPG